MGNPELAQSFSEFLTLLRSTQDHTLKVRLIDEYLFGKNGPIVEDNKVHFIFRGNANAVAVPGEFNRWNPSRALMERVEGTDLFFHTDTIPVDGRVEYKFCVDNTWILDPLNRRTARGGYGENSDVWMPKYRESISISNPNAPQGNIDSIWVDSQILRRSHPIYIYTPPTADGDRPLPVMYVTDGGEYLSLGQMHRALDSLIQEERICPLHAVFIDPRTDPNDVNSNMRMLDYSASSYFLDFLENELIPLIEKQYAVSRSPNERVIMGASMGGLISTYAVLARPELVKRCAAQSPAYLQADSAVIKLIDALPSIGSEVYIQTGTIKDTEIEARLVYRALKEKGACVLYEEFPEGHNWTNWRCRLTNILLHFFPRYLN